jgi:hypothetical protein
LGGGGPGWGVASGWGGVPGGSRLGWLSIGVGFWFGGVLHHLAPPSETFRPICLTSCLSLWGSNSFWAAR